MPRYAQDAIFNQGQSRFGSGMDFGSNFGQGLSSFLGGVFTDPRRSFSEAQRSYGPWMDRASGVFNPFIQEGQKGMGRYGDFLEGMRDPSEFINKLMGGYQESPYSKYLKDYINRAGINAASESGLIGSTPYMQAAQENASGIVSRDMQDWLSRVLGISTQYGQGLGDLMRQGATAAGQQANIFGQRGADEALLSYGKESADHSRTGNIIGGLLKMFGL